MKLIYNTTNQTLYPYPRKDELPVIGLVDTLLEMDVIQEDQPSYNPQTQFLEKTETIDVAAKTVTFGWNIKDMPPKLYSAEEWMSYKGYSSVRLLTLADIEQKLVAAGKTSPKVVATRSWVDAVLMQFANNPVPQETWDEPPYTFEETLQEALSILNS